MKLPFFNESLNAFLAVAAERSFSAAAKKLGVTQSAVTKAVARLEKELEVELFDRGCRPVMLTEEAMLLLKDVLACQHTLENTAEFMQSRSNLKPVYRIGVIEGLSKSLMPQLIKALQSEASEIVTQIGTSLVLVEKLVRNELDFAFTSAAYDEVRGLYRTKLFEEESIVLMPKAMAAKRDSWTWSQLQLCGIPFLHFCARRRRGQNQRCLSQSSEHQDAQSHRGRLDGHHDVPHCAGHGVDGRQSAHIGAELRFD